MRRYVHMFLMGTMVPAALFLILNVWVDPYRIFHKPSKNEDQYGGNIRILASGIINTGTFDSLILGTSMAENFSPAEASRVFGNRFVNISLSGSSLVERALVLNDALRKRALTDVIYSLDDLAFDTDSILKTPIAPYAYLYDENPVNDLLIYASDPKAFRFVFCGNVIFSSTRLCPGTRSLEHLVEWYSDQEYSKRFGGLNKWLEAKNNAQVQQALASIATSIRTIRSGRIRAIQWPEVALAREKHEKIFRDDLLKTIAAYPNTRFYLFFPPYSRLNFAIKKQSDPQAFEEYLDIIRFVVKACAPYRNVQVFGFETESFPDHLANYKDTEHYHPRINSEILRWMHNGEHVLTPGNLAAYIQEITQLAQNYPLENIGAQIDQYLQHTPN